MKKIGKILFISSKEPKATSLALLIVCLTPAGYSLRECQVGNKASVKHVLAPRTSLDDWNDCSHVSSSIGVSTS